MVITVLTARKRIAYGSVHCVEIETMRRTNKVLVVLPVHCGQVILARYVSEFFRNELLKCKMWADAESGIDCAKQLETFIGVGHKFGTAVLFGAKRPHVPIQVV